MVRLFLHVIRLADITLLLLSGIDRLSSCPEMPSPVSPVSPMYYVGPPPPPEALRGLAFAPPMVGPPAYPYFQPPADPDADAQDQAKLLKQIEFYFRSIH